MTILQRAGVLAVAVVAFALFLILGRAVDHAPDPGWMMFAEMQWVNHSTLIAWWLTWFGWIDILLPLAIVLIVIAIRFPAWRSRVTFAIVVVTDRVAGHRPLSTSLCAPAPVGLGGEARDGVFVSKLAHRNCDGLLSTAGGLRRAERSARQSLAGAGAGAARAGDHVVAAGPWGALPDRCRGRGPLGQRDRGYLGRLLAYQRL